VSNFEALIRGLTRPINTQYPRPWLTRMRHPERARVFVVGRNQATGFPVAKVGSHDDYLDALFNRNGRSCRALYDQVRAEMGKGPSPTRMHLDALTDALEQQGASDVLETNVVCYSTPMSADLNRAEHAGGRKHGTEIFLALLDAIRPRILIAHGAGTRYELARLLESSLPDPATSPTGGIPQVKVRLVLNGRLYAPTVFTLPSLAPPAYNRWAKWATIHMHAVSEAVAASLHA
jgi:hypothetical protein